ncbi:zinc finger, RING/FYVE/PHD-type [Artemisia annua]|uniref:RING-type E3 ubiquitin transferase n=1 Tax=Artemisia annua TaxID=35608 RepID=A0A2U1KNF3_ARTAN|nr:zinc finger, RING/FYVE/PHD-type [Artemisia annua]
MASCNDQINHELQDHMFQASPQSHVLMLDILNLVQPEELDDVAILNDQDTSAFGIILMNDHDEAFRESSFIVNGLELEDMHHALGLNTSINSGSGLSEETILDQINHQLQDHMVPASPHSQVLMLDILNLQSVELDDVAILNDQDTSNFGIILMNDQDEAFRESSLIVNGLELEDMHHALGLNTSINSSGSGLSEETIFEHLQVITRKAKFGGENKGEKEEIDTCSICYDEYEENDKIGKLQCGHLFDVECIKSWLLRKNSCPMCRATALTV